jgi:hypothetical protein
MRATRRGEERELKLKKDHVLGFCVAGGGGKDAGREAL